MPKEGLLLGSGQGDTKSKGEGTGKDESMAVKNLNSEMEGI